MAASLNLRRIAFTVIVSLGTAVLPAPRHSGRAQEVRPVRTSAITPNGWEFIDVAHEGQNGFTIVNGA